MSRVQQRNTKPEIIIRSLLHSLGYRFRLHNKKLPGTPDIVLPKYKTVIFIHGCFWHQHKGCRKSRRPSSNNDYWNKKLDRNLQRDEENEKKLTESGWKVITIWECELKDIRKAPKNLVERINN